MEMMTLVLTGFCIAVARSTISLLSSSIKAHYLARDEMCRSFVGVFTQRGRPDYCPDVHYFN